MKKTFFFLIMLFAMALLVFPGLAEEEANVTYGETYLCGDAYTVRISQQPQMFAQSGEKILYYLTLPNAQGLTTSHQIYVQHGKQTEEDVMLIIRG